MCLHVQQVESCKRGRVCNRQREKWGPKFPPESNCAVFLCTFFVYVQYMYIFAMSKKQNGKRKVVHVQKFPPTFTKKCRKPSGAFACLLACLSVCLCVCLLTYRAFKIIICCAFGSVRILARRVRSAFICLSAVLRYLLFSSLLSCRQRLGHSLHLSIFQDFTFTQTERRH